MRIASFVVAAVIGAAAASPTSIEVERPWARATVPGASTGAAFMTVRSNGASDQLLGASTPVAEQVDLHQSIMKDGMAQMRGVDAIDIAPGRPATLAPGGLHFMLMGLKHPLAEGTTFPLTLKFRKRDPVTVDVRVAGMGATSAP
jgi:hypothetical protein